MSEMVFVRTNVSTLTATDNHVLHRLTVIIIIIIRELLRIMTIKMGIKPMDSSVSHLWHWWIQLWFLRETGERTVPACVEGGGAAVMEREAALLGSLLFISTLCELTWIVVGYVYVKALWHTNSHLTSTLLRWFFPTAVRLLGLLTADPR